MTLLILFAVFLSGAVFCSAIFGKRAESVLPLSFFAIVFLLYGCGLFGFLEQGVYGVLALSVVLYGWSLAAVWRKRAFRAFANNLFTPGFFVYALLFVAVWYSNRGKLLHFYDEFTHWGDVVKVMCQFNDFATHPGSGSMFATYPPAMALLQYFSQKVNMLASGSPAMDEGLLYMAYQWTLLSLYMPFLARLTFRRPWQIVLATGMIFSLPLFSFLSSAYALIYIDSFLGAMGGFVCLYAFLCKRTDHVELTMLFLALFTMTLTKDVGLLFAFAGAGIFLAGQLTTGAFSGDAKKAEWTRAILVFAAVVIAKASWSIHVSIRGAAVMQESFLQPVDVHELIRVLAGTSEHAWRKTVLNKYVNQFFNPIFRLFATDGYITHAALLILIGAGLAWLKGIYAKEDLKCGDHFGWLAVIWGLATALYIAGMGVLYLFKYNWEEAMVLSAWNRYMDTLICLGFFILAAGCMLAFQKKLLQRNAKIIVIAALLLLTPWQGVINVLSRAEANSAISSQQPYVALAEEMHAIVQREGSEAQGVYLVFSEDTQPYLSMRYRLRPLRVNDEAWPLGKLKAEEDAGEELPDASELKRLLLKEYDYVILCSVDERFTEAYAPLFGAEEAIREGCIYRVDRQTGSLEMVR